MTTNQSIFGAGRALTQQERTRRLTRMAMLAAISVILVFINFPILPAAPWLKYDPADIPILLGAFTMGPAAGFMILAVVSLIQGLFLSGDGIIGALMHFCASGTLILVAGLIYRGCKQSTKGMIIGLIAGCLGMASIMIPMNLLFTPLLFGVEVDVVKTMILPVLLPFNLLKAGINAVLFFALFKGRDQLLKSRAS